MSQRNNNLFNYFQFFDIEWLVFIWYSQPSNSMTWNREQLETHGSYLRSLDKRLNSRSCNWIAQINRRRNWRSHPPLTPPLSRDLWFGLRWKSLHRHTSFWRQRVWHSNLNYKRKKANAFQSSHGNTSANCLHIIGSLSQ